MSVASRLPTDLGRFAGLTGTLLVIFGVRDTGLSWHTVLLSVGISAVVVTVLGVGPWVGRRTTALVTSRRGQAGEPAERTDP